MLCCLLLARHFLAIGKSMPQDVPEVDASWGSNEAAQEKHLLYTVRLCVHVWVVGEKKTHCNG